MSELLLAFDGHLLVSEHEGSPLDAAHLDDVIQQRVNCQ
jgi:hypothetical protein